MQCSHGFNYLIWPLFNRVGEMCLALFVEDNSWYRGVCKRITGQKALILYCDFGNLEMVSVERIKPITTEVLHGVYATTCFIDGKCYLELFFLIINLILIYRLQ